MTGRVPKSPKKMTAPAVENKSTKHTTPPDKVPTTPQETSDKGKDTEDEAQDGPQSRPEDESPDGSVKKKSPAGSSKLASSDTLPTTVTSQEDESEYCNENRLSSVPVEVDEDCSCKNCNKEVYAQFPHKILDRTFRKVPHIPLSELSDLYSYEATALAQEAIDSFTKRRLAGDPQFPGYRDAVAEFRYWSKHRCQPLVENPQKISTAQLQYLYALLNDIFFLGSLRGTHVVRRTDKKMDRVLGSTCFPDLKAKRGETSYPPILTIAINPVMILVEKAVTETALKEASKADAKNISGVRKVNGAGKKKPRPGGRNSAKPKATEPRSNRDNGMKATKKNKGNSGENPGS